MEEEDHEMGQNKGGEQGNHHAQMVKDFRRRFWISLVLSVPVLVLAPIIQGFLGIKEVIAFPGESYVQFLLSTAIFF